MATLLAIVGAESTGKTTLAAALALRLATETGLRVAWVSETLREWCDHVGRTPLVHEQASILRQQHARIDAAAEQHDVVVCDTTGLMTAVYSQWVFGDRSLHARAVQLQRRMALTLLTAVDLPWVADGQQRDGAHVREGIDAAIRELLVGNGLPWALVGGQGEARVEAAVAATLPAIQAATAGQRARNRFGPGRQARWSCSCCSDAALGGAFTATTAVPAPAAKPP